MSKVSIITTTYRHEGFIAHAIDSILSQSFTDWELLIGDDSPDDTTWNIIQEYIGKYPEKIKAWHHMPNKGIVENTNFLLGKISTDTEYIAFLEGDDIYTPDNLEQKLHIFNTHPEVQLVYSDLSFIDSGNRVILESFFQYRRIPFFQDTTISPDTFLLMPAGPIASWSTGMIRRAMFEKYGVIARWEDKRYSISDYEFYFQVSTNHHIFGIKKPLTLYRRHGGNLSGANGGTSGDLERWIDIMYAQGNISQTIYNKKKSWTAIVSAIFSLEAGDKKAAIQWLRKSLNSSIMYKSHYKIAIIGFIVLPQRVTSFILRKLIKRGS